MSSSADRIYLVDASPYIFRAYFSLPESMTDPQGTPVNAVYGFAGFLIKLIEAHQPSHLALAFDGSLTTSFRNEIYPEYKAQREPPPDSLKAQVERCMKVGEALGATCLIDDAYEADDLIGTLIETVVPDLDRGPGSGADTATAVVVSSDKDLAQLVTDRIHFLDFSKDVTYGIEEVKEKFGVRPDQIPDYLALAGDSVDNIPGVKGIGAKRAAALLQALDSLETIYQRLDEVETLPVRGAKAMRRKLEEGREMAELSRRLTEVAREAPVGITFADIEYHGAEAAKIDPLFEELGFERIRERIPRWK